MNANQLLGADEARTILIEVNERLLHCLESLLQSPEKTQPVEATVDSFENLAKGRELRLDGWIKPWILR